MDFAPPPHDPAPAAGGGLLRAVRDTTFRSLRHRDYRLYFAGQLVSFTGSWMQSAALMWLMFDRTHDLRWPSWLLVAQVGPTILLGPFGGALADRVPKLALITATQIGFALNAAVLTAVVAADAASAWVIVALQMTSGLIQAVDLPTRLAFVPDLVPKADLANAVGLNSLLFNSARAVGPAVAGVLFAAVDAATGFLPPNADRVRVGAAVCFGLNAASFAAVVAALRAIRAGGRPDPTKPSAGSVWAGVRYLLGHKVLGGLIGLTLVVCVFGWPVQTLLAGYTTAVLGRGHEAYNALMSGVGAGALLGALTTATFGGTGRRRGPTLLTGALAAGVGVLGLTLAGPGGVGVAVGSAGCVGFGLILYLSTGQSTMQMTVPDAMRGRVMAVWAMTLSATAPVGHVLAGEAAAAVGVVNVLRGMAAGLLAAAAVLAVVVLRKRS